MESFEIDDVELAFNMHGVDVRKSVYNAIERALGKRNPNAEIVTNTRGEPDHDGDLRERERVPLDENPEEYFEQQVEPYVENAWINKSKKYHDDKDGDLGVIGYEINFERHFYEYDPPRAIDDIDDEIKELEAQITNLLNEVTK